VQNLGALYKEIKTIFKNAGFGTPELDAKLLISFALGGSPNDVLLKPDTLVTTNAVLNDAVARRLQHEPVSKIIGMRGFYGLEFEVNANVLDPRADTETIVDTARQFMNQQTKILDICTGTGCIPLALLSVFSNATALAVDISDDALSIAQRNAVRLGYDARITFKQSDWLENVEGVFDLITCNPPYIPTADIESLDKTVRDYDPILALDGGDDGLNPYRILFPQILNFLKMDGTALFEIGINQAHDVSRIAADAGLYVTKIVRDLGGIERVVCVQKQISSKK
jgi:release factor glutamine methyltransferase